MIVESPIPDAKYSPLGKILHCIQWKSVLESFDAISVWYFSHTDAADTEAKYSSLGENTTPYTKEQCPVRVLMRSSLYTLHILIFSDPDTKYSPFEENTTLSTQEECPVKVLISPLDTLHTLIVLSPEAKNSPLGENVTHLI